MLKVAAEFVILKLISGGRVIDHLTAMDVREVDSEQLSLLLDLTCQCSTNSVIQL